MAHIPTIIQQINENIYMYLMENTNVIKYHKMKKITDL